MAQNLTLIFDQFGHPNQPFWLNHYNRLRESEVLNARAFSHSKYASLGNNVCRIKATSKWEKLKNSFKYYLLNYNNKWIYQDYIRYASLIEDKNRLVHILNAQQYPPIRKFLSDKKKIFSFRGYETLVRPDNDMEWRDVLQLIFEDASKLHFVSTYIQEFAINKFNAPKEKCVVIHRSVDSEFFNPGKKDYDVKGIVKLLTVGRLTWQKGYQSAIETLNTLKKEKVAFKYFIVGTGNEEENLKMLVSKYGLSKNVEFMGNLNRKQLKNILEETDIYLQPSISEALPNSILEASAMALPILTTHAGGISEVIKNEENGLISNINDINSLASQLTKLIKSKDLRKALGNRARTYVLDNHSVASEEEKWLELYLNIHDDIN